MFLSPILLRAQQTVDSIFGQPTISVEGILPGTMDIEVDQEGNLYLLQPRKHKVIKRFRNSGFDSSLAIGGKGMGKEGFNFPNKIAVQNRQSVFMLDYMNRRLVQLNTNLKVIEDVNFLTIDLDLDEEDGESLWPTSFVVGPSGELFLLNQEDFKIYKISSGGQFQRSFAGMDYGQGSVKEPWDLAINSANVLFAIDSINQEVQLYDLFGTSLYRLAPALPFRWHHAVPVGTGLLFLGQQAVFYYDLNSKQGSIVKLEGEGKILDAAVGRDFLYILFENRVNLYAY